MNYLLTCDSCKEEFDEEERMPMILSECGHTFCKSCIMDIIENEEEKLCPECGSKIRETSEGKLRKNIKILKFMHEREE